MPKLTEQELKQQRCNIDAEFWLNRLYAASCITANTNRIVLTDDQFVEAMQALLSDDMLFVAMSLQQHKMLYINREFTVFGNIAKTNVSVK